VIITRAPFRISFFGGGTDYPQWYLQHGGAVISATIDKYCYISCRYLPPFFEHRSRIVWSQIELPMDHAQIKHPAVREALRFTGIQNGVEIHHDGDLPARSGMGSSSSFTVALLHALYALKGEMCTKMQLALDAIHVEQALMGDTVGSQDQTAAAFGGLNRIAFQVNGSVDVHPIVLSHQRMSDFFSHLMLVFTGFSRTASEIAAMQMEAMPSKTAELTTICQMVDEAHAILYGATDLTDFGRLLHESWMLKRSLTSRISTPAIDEIYEAARAAGALGGKLLGAGGGGFALFFVRPQDRQRVIERLAGLMHVPFRPENHGSQIIYYEPSEPAEYAALHEARNGQLSAPSRAGQASGSA